MKSHRSRAFTLAPLYTTKAEKQFEQRPQIGGRGTHASAAHLEEEFGDIKMSIGTGIMEGDQPTLVFGMHISSMLEKQLDHAHSVITSGQVKWSGLTKRICKTKFFWSELELLFFRPPRGS